GIGEGTGMGLAVALSVMQRHGGTLHVDEVKPCGARFIAIMPRHQAALVEQRPVVVTRPQSQSILVVDDELSVRQVVARVLTHDKHTVSVATSAEEALDLLRKQTFHIIISDLGMPGMNGWDLLAQARELYPEIATVLMTGWGFQYDTMNAQGRGVDLVLPKPFEMQDLRKAIADLSGAATPTPESTP
ncbi:MAG: response regulator, partial [Herpetosiphonaceae bacterium]|nr:response regulator [Herpetosiphonaceae bacterium]